MSHDGLQYFDGYSPTSEESNENFKVVIRIRPPLPRELDGERAYVDVMKVQRRDDEEIGKVITISEHLEGDEGSRGILSSQTFTFDTVYDQNSTQHTLYENTAKPAVLSVLQGYNATMIAYGQTGTGKTYTMEGFTSDDDRGIIPRATEEIFNYIQNCGNSRTKFLVRASYLQIYNEVISDLIKPNPAAKLCIREDKQKGVYVEGLSEWIVRSPQEIYGLMDMGGKVRATGATRMSEMSSRSHAIFTIICEQGEEAETEEERRISVKVGKLNIVDLAGSEKVRQTGATGQRFEESKKINWSLSALGKVISVLTDNHARHHVPYRNSKLTRILEDSLGGNCKTTMIAMVSPAMESYSESLSTLKFANRAKNIKNEARINEDIDQKAELRKYERELKVLRQALMEATKSVHESKRQLDLQERKRTSESDKIAELERNMLMGGQKIEDHPAFQQAIQRVNEEYNAKLEELDKERQAIEEDKAQVDRYKQLLLKQRDIMIALTARLNERDESILALQEELDAYDLQQQMLEDALDQKTAQLIQIQSKVYSGEQTSMPTAQPQSLPPNMTGEKFVNADTIRRVVEGEVRYLTEEQRLREAEGNTDIAPNQMLNPHQKIQELYQVISCLAKAVGQSDTSKLRELQEEKTSLEYLLKEKLQNMVQNDVSDIVTACKKEVEDWKQRYSILEEKRRAAEHIADVLQRNGPLDIADVPNKVREFMATEAELLKKPLLDHIAELNNEITKKEDECLKLMKDADRLRFELHHLRNREDSDPEHLEKIWNMSQSIEEDMKLSRKNSARRTAFDDLSNRPRNNSIMKSSDETVKQLEQKLESMKWQYDKVRQEANDRLEEKAQQIRSLELSLKDYNESRQRLAHHVQERKALKIIMEEKIKKRVDSIEKLFREFSSSVANKSSSSLHNSLPHPDQHKKLDDQIKALQSLVNAAITAMGEEASVR